MTTPTTKPAQPVAIVTGATAGIGRYTAEGLATRGVKVVLACRNIKAAEQVVDEIKQSSPGADVVVGPHLDLSRLDSVRAFAHAYNKLGWPCDLLVNNAGTNYIEPAMTEGIGALSQINYLGPYALTRLLEPVLIRSAPSTIVNLSSIMHRVGDIPDVDAFLHTWGAGGYDATKLANVLFAYEAQRRLGPLGVQSCAVDPGGVFSSIWKGSAIFGRPPMSWILGALYAPPCDGAQATLDACAAALQKKTLPKKGFKRGGGAAQHASQFKFYARGLFASPLITGYCGTRHPPHAGDGLRKMLWGCRAVLLSVLDWPLRRITGGRINSTTWQVPSVSCSYDPQRAAQLWDMSADVVRVPRTPSTGKKE